jgi:hypothetical protein
MIAHAALAGTMVAPTTVPFPAAAAAVDAATFPAALRGIAQARMGSAKPLTLDTASPQGAAPLPKTGSSARSNSMPLDRMPAKNEIASPSPTATVHGRETDAKESAAPITTTSPSQSSTAVTAAAQEDQASVPAKAGDAEATKRTIVKAQATTSEALHPSKADLHKVGAGGTGDPTRLAGGEAAPNNTVPHGEQREASQPAQDTTQAPADPSILPAQVSTRANYSKNDRQQEHAGKAVSTDGSPIPANRSASNPDNAVADPDAASAAVSVAKMEPNGSANFKAELSAAPQAALASQLSQLSQLSQDGGYVVSAPTGTSPNPLANPHSAGGDSKSAGLSEAGMESTVSGAASYSESLQHESHGTLVATPTTLEVGVPRGAEGWLKIRAEVGSDGISASLSTASHAGQSALRDQLPAINAFLQGEQIHASATLLDKTTLPSASNGGSSAAMDHGLGREGSAQREQRQFSQAAHQETPELAEDSHTASPPSGFGVLLPPGSARAGGSLSVLA